MTGCVDSKRSSNSSCLRPRRSLIEKAACGLPCCVLMAPQCPSVCVACVPCFAIERLRAPSVPSRLRVQESTMWSIAGWAFQEGSPAPLHWPFTTRRHDGARVCVCALNATPNGFLIRNHADLHLPRRLSWALLVAPVVSATAAVLLLSVLDSEKFLPLLLCALCAQCALLPLRRPPGRSVEPPES